MGAIIYLHKNDGVTTWVQSLGQVKNKISSPWRIKYERKEEDDKWVMG